MAARVPRNKEECEHYARYQWASRRVAGDVLDVACGTGYGARILARRARVSGVDRSAEAVERARSRAAGNFVTAEVPPLPFPDDVFDYVVSFETIEHVADDARFMQEVGRVLRPGGTLLMSSPNASISAPDGVPLNRWHVHEYTRSSLTALVTSAGLQVVELCAQGFPPNLRRGHRIAWRINGLTWMLPARIRSAARAVLGDCEVRALDQTGPAPGYWVLLAVNHAG